MSTHEFFALFGALAAVAIFYIGYWTAWCWLWHWSWPSGPEWFVRPHVSSFLLVNITGLILTLVICSKASE